MPVRARRAKRRFNTDAQIRAWWMLFTCGEDYLDELADFGFATDADKLTAAPDAWDRLGADYILRWDLMQPWEKSRETPWAVEQFGQPSCR
jgi:hypothetical protein